MTDKVFWRTLGACAFFLVFLVCLATSRYEGNVSALLHVGREFGEAHAVPSNVVLYKDGGYDGMLYYQITRNIPQFFDGGITTPPMFDNAYRWQRILLPLSTYILSLGKEQLFPLMIFLINAAAVLGTLALFLQHTKRFSIHALTLVFNPAALVGILFALTEPLSLFFITAFLVLWEKRGRRIDWQQIALLTLAVFARETAVFLIVLLFLWSVWKKYKRDAALLAATAIPFLAWQGILTLRFGKFPVNTGTNMIGIPFSGPLNLLQCSLPDLNVYRLSAVCLLIFIVAVAVSLFRRWQKGERNVLLFLLSGLIGVMFIMDAHIWGVITSIGRVVTPFYPVYAFAAIQKDTWLEKSLSAILIGISILAAIGIALSTHPFILSS